MKQFCIFFLMAFLCQTTLNAQRFWLTTYEFPDGAKTGIALSGDTALFVSSTNTVLRSYDEGRNFQRVLTTASPLVSLFANAEGKVWAGSIGKIYRSRDYGKTWDSIKLSHNYLITQFLKVKNGLLFSISNDINDTGFVGGGVYISKDDGINWSPRNTGLGNNLSADNIVADKNGRLFLTVRDEIGSKGGLYMSENQGQTWQHIPLSVDGLGAIPNDIDVRIASGLSISPQDSLYISFEGVAGRVFVRLNLRKHLNDVMNPNFWQPTHVANTSLAFIDRALYPIHFARNGDFFSSARGSGNVGGTFFKRNNTKNWSHHTAGLGFSETQFLEQQFFAEKSNGKIFMVQWLDERIYTTDTSRLIPTSTPSVFEPKMVTVYPNPVQKGGSLQIDLPETIDNQQIIITNSQGQIIQQGVYSGKNLNIKTPTVAGIYWLRIIGKKAFHSRFVVF